MWQKERCGADKFHPYAIDFHERPVRLTTVSEGLTALIEHDFEHNFSRVPNASRAVTFAEVSSYPHSLLLAIRSELENVLSLSKGREPCELDIAIAHFNPDLVAQVYERRAIRSGRGWRQLQSVHCSHKRCSLCPHGPVWYRYRPRERGKVISVRYEGSPAFSIDVLERMRQHAREPIAYLTTEELLSVGREGLIELIEKRKAGTK